jgi:hypothetical protein
LTFTTTATLNNAFQNVYNIFAGTAGAYVRKGCD